LRAGNTTLPTAHSNHPNNLMASHPQRFRYRLRCRRRRIPSDVLPGIANRDRRTRTAPRGGVKRTAYSRRRTIPRLDGEVQGSCQSLPTQFHDRSRPLDSTCTSERTGVARLGRRFRRKPSSRTHSSSRYTRDSTKCTTGRTLETGLRREIASRR
jgi:hypothetical protein